MDESLDKKCVISVLLNEIKDHSLQQILRETIFNSPNGVQFDKLDVFEIVNFYRPETVKNKGV